MFFFSSRRRHTRFDCDWSSDVCSSDLQFPPAYVADSNGTPMHSWRVLILPYIEANHIYDRYDQTQPWDSATNRQLRSEERRVGKERRWRWPAVQSANVQRERSTGWCYI